MEDNTLVESSFSAVTNAPISALLTSEHSHPAASAKWEIEWLTKLITAYTRMPCGSRDGLRNE
jgi:hypothetical protein